MDVLEDKEDKYNVLFYCKSDLPYGESSQDMASAEIGVRSKGGCL